MKNHKRSYEQYCWVKEKNIVFEETVFHNGTNRLECKNFGACKNEGGCKNEILYALFKENSVDSKESF